MGIIKKVLTPVDYIRINHPEKRWFDFYVPIFFAVIVSICVFMLPKHIALIGKDGLVSLTNGILQILSGFYIASMAAVATFQKDGMDAVMDGYPPTLRGKDLTRRKFLTYLFGYLAFLSIAMYFLGGTAQILSKNISEIDFFKISAIKYSLLGVYLFFIFNILTTTVLGMYFMIDKMHENKSQLKK